MVVVVDLGLGNLHSVANALDAAGADVTVSSAPADIEAAERLVFPGVGAFGEGAAQLAASGLIPVLEEQVLRKGKPVLGICLGMQLMAEVGLEYGEHRGLGWVPGRVVAIPAAPGVKLPHMGWNEVAFTVAHPLFEGLGAKPAFYFAHSYHLEGAQPAATAEYGRTLVAGVVAGNLAGVQFHPEKSQKVGLKLLRNFLRWAPAC